MASTTIAKASLLLALDGTGLNKGLDQSKDKVNSWGKDVKKNATDATKSLKDVKAPDKLPTLTQHIERVFDPSQLDKLPSINLTVHLIFDKSALELPDMTHKVAAPSAGLLPVAGVAAAGFGIAKITAGFGEVATASLKVSSSLAKLDDSTSKTPKIMDALPVEEPKMASIAGHGEKIGGKLNFPPVSPPMAKLVEHPEGVFASGFPMQGELEKDRIPKIPNWPMPKMPPGPPPPPAASLPPSLPVAPQPLPTIDEPDTIQVDYSRPAKFMDAAAQDTRPPKKKKTKKAEGLPEAPTSPEAPPALPTGPQPLAGPPLPYEVPNMAIIKPKQPRSPFEEQSQIAKDFEDQGKTVKEIAVLMNRSEGSVRKYLKGVQDAADHVGQLPIPLDFPKPPQSRLPVPMPAFVPPPTPPPAPPPSTAPWPRFGSQQEGIRQANADMPKRLDTPTARLAKEDRIFGKGDVSGGKAFPAMQIPAIKLADLPFSTRRVDSNLKVPGKMPTPPSLPSPPPGGGDAAGAGGDAAGALGMSKFAKIAIPLAAITAGIYAVKKLADGFQEVAEKALLASNAARGLGVGLEGFQKIGHAASVAGVDAETLKSGILSLQSALKASDSEAGRVFDQLGLSFEKLRELPVDEQIGQIAGALAGIKDPVQQAASGVAIFGDSYQKLQPFLSKGPEGLAALSAEASKLGIALNEADASKLLSANEGIKRLGAGWEGLKNSLAVFAAPAIEMLVDWLIKARDTVKSLTAGWSEAEGAGTTALGGLTKSVSLLWDTYQVGQGISDKYITAPLIRAGGVVADVVGNISGYFNGLGDDIVTVFGGPVNSAWESIKSGVQSVSDFFVAAWKTIVEFYSGAWDSIKEISNNVYNWLAQPVKDAIDGVVGFFGYLKDKLTEAWNAIQSVFKKTKAGDAVRALGDAVEQGGQAKIDAFGTTGDKLRNALKTIEDNAKQAKENLAKINPIDELTANVIKGINALETELRDAVSKIGLTGPQAKVFDLQKQNPDGKFDKQIEKLKEMAELEKNIGIGFSTIKMPPLETFNRSVEGLDAMLEAGRITADQYGMGLVEAAKGLQDATGVGQTKTVGGAFKDSREAVSSIIKADLQTQNQDPTQRLIQAQKEATEIQKKQLETAEKIRQLLDERKEQELEIF